MKSAIRELRRVNAFIGDIAFVGDGLLQSNAERTRAVSPVDGLTFALKDNFCTDTHPATCGSKFLSEYHPSYTATPVQRLVDNGAALIGKTNMDEFGMGSGNLFSYFGPVRNPWPQKEHISSDGESSNDFPVPGGSSGGSAAAVSMKACHFALGSDTGGSVRLPAAFCGVVGLKPTYGRVSRFGLIPLASSMDTVGVLSPTVALSAQVLDIISGWDVLDSTTARKPHTTCANELSSTDDPKELLKGLRIGVAKNCGIDRLSSSVKTHWLSVSDKLASAGAEMYDVSLPHFHYGVSCYTVLCAAEVSSNFAKYSSLLFGRTESKEIDAAKNFVATNRVAGLGPVVQHRIIAGRYFLSYHGRQYYEQALRVRQLITDDFQKVFSTSSLSSTCSPSVDVILTPVSLGPAPLRSEMEKLGPVESSVYDTFSAPVNLSGLPAVSVPVGLSECGLPIGLQLIGNWWREDQMLRAATAVEKLSLQH